MLLSCMGKACPSGDPPEHDWTHDDAFLVHANCVHIQSAMLVLQGSWVCKDTKGLAPTQVFKSASDPQYCVSQHGLSRLRTTDCKTAHRRG